MNAKVGVFDSGIGGLSVANAIKNNLENVEVIFRNDQQHMPYGDKGLEEVLSLSLPIVKSLENDGCQVIVLACDTISTTLLEHIEKHIKVPLIAVEPMILQASQKTKSNKITVCATPNTLASSRYQYLIEKYAKHLSIFEPDCSDWAYLIEKNEMYKETISDCILPSISSGSDVVVLGCTHYHWIDKEVKLIVGHKASVLQPEQLIVDQVREALKRLD